MPKNENRAFFCKLSKIALAQNTTTTITNVPLEWMSFVIFLGSSFFRRLYQGSLNDTLSILNHCWMMLLLKAQISNVFLFFCVFVILFFQMQCGQVGITSGMAQSHHHIIRWEWEVVSGPSRRPHGEHSGDGVQHSDPKRWRPRWRALRVLNPH